MGNILFKEKQIPASLVPTEDTSNHNVSIPLENTSTITPLIPIPSEMVFEGALNANLIAFSQLNLTRKVRVIERKFSGLTSDNSGQFLKAWDSMKVVGHYQRPVHETLDGLEQGLRQLNGGLDPAEMATFDSMAKFMNSLSRSGGIEAQNKRVIIAMWVYPAGEPRKVNSQENPNITVLPYESRQSVTSLSSPEKPIVVQEYSELLDDSADTDLIEIDIIELTPPASETAQIIASQPERPVNVIDFPQQPPAAPDQSLPQFNWDAYLGDVKKSG